MPRWRSACWLVLPVVVATSLPAQASDKAFPFGSELMLDAAPMYGSKRIPMLEIDDNGTTSIDLWCQSSQAQSTVGSDGTITIVPAAATPAQCTPERATGDQDLLTALSQVTNWRRNGDLIELTGPTTLRFRLMTN